MSAAPRPAGSTGRAPTLLLVAHGTREPTGGRVIDRLAALVRARIAADVRVAYVDVVSPTVAEAMSSISGPVVAMPAFLAAGYHVRTDLPEQLGACATSARGSIPRPAGDGPKSVTITDPLGPSARLAEAMLFRLRRAGWRRGDRVIFAAAGSSDSRALDDVSEAAAMLGRLVNRSATPLPPTFVTTATPRTADMCPPPSRCDRTFIAPYLLAPGMFHSRLRELPARVADPLGTHGHVVELVVHRYRTACAADVDHRADPAA